MAGKIKIISEGRSGKIRYSEGWLKANVCEFYWEFGGGGTIVTVRVPAEEKWDVTYPWAKGRRKEIVEFVAEEVRRMQAPSSKIVWEKDGFSLVTV
jgi:hypothetical protein